MERDLNSLEEVKKTIDEGENIPMGSPQHNEDSLFFDGLENFTCTLEEVALMAESVKEKPSRWKFLITNLHDALQILMVSFLQSRHSFGALSKDGLINAMKNLEDQDVGKIGNEKEYLERFMKLYKKCKKKPKTQIIPRRIKTTAQQNKDVRKLNILRNELMHFAPGSWRIEKAGLPRIIGNVVDVIDALRKNFSPYSYYDFQNDPRINDAMERIRNADLL